MYGCEHCDGGFITTSETFKSPEGGLVTLRWCSNVHCNYNERLSEASPEGKKFIAENMTE